MSSYEEEKGLVPQWLSGYLILDVCVATGHIVILHKRNNGPTFLTITDKDESCQINTSIQPGKTAF